MLHVDPGLDKKEVHVSYSNYLPATMPWYTYSKEIIVEQKT